MALAFLTCVATILWCILLTRRQRNGLDRLLTGLLGSIAIYQALRILSDSGLAAFARFRSLEGWVDLISACLYLLAAFILKTSSIDRAATKVHLRLVEADLVETKDKAAEMTSAVLRCGSRIGPSAGGLFAARHLRHRFSGHHRLLESGRGKSAGMDPA